MKELEFSVDSLVPLEDERERRTTRSFNTRAFDIKSLQNDTLCLSNTPKHLGTILKHVAKTVFLEIAWSIVLAGAMCFACFASWKLVDRFDFVDEEPTTLELFYLFAFDRSVSFFITAALLLNFRNIFGSKAMRPFFNVLFWFFGLAQNLLVLALWAVLSFKFDAYRSICDWTFVSYAVLCLWCGHSLSMPNESSPTSEEEVPPDSNKDPSCMSLRTHRFVLIAGPMIVLHGMFAVFFNVLLPVFKSSSTTVKVLFSALVWPATMAFVSRLLFLGARKLHGLNHPGTSFLLLVWFQGFRHVAKRLLLSSLPSAMDTVSGCALMGILEIADRATILKREECAKCLGECALSGQSGRELLSARSWRLRADLAIFDVVLEVVGTLSASFLVVLVRTWVLGHSFDDIVSFHFWNAMIQLGFGVFTDIVGMCLMEHHGFPIVAVFNKQRRVFISTTFLVSLAGILYLKDRVIEALETVLSDH